MSTLKVGAINNPSASSGGLVISATGNVTGAGLDLITTQSFSAVSSVSVNNCFTATYDNYRVVFEGSGSNLGAGLYGRLRVSGTDATASYYYANTYVRVTGSITAAGGSNVAFGSVNVGLSSNRGASSSSFDVVKPFETVRTSLLGTFYGGDATGPFAGQIGVVLDTSTSYDGFTLYPSAGTTTGTVSVYGYRK